MAKNAKASNPAEFDRGRRVTRESILESWEDVDVVASVSVSELSTAEVLPNPRPPKSESEPVLSATDEGDTPNRARAASKRSSMVRSDSCRPNDAIAALAIRVMGEVNL